jgi:hypothetical protein
MGKRIEYKDGDTLGDFGVIYLKEVETEGRNRKAEFKCGRCGAHFIAFLQDVKTNHTSSCGCRRSALLIDSNTTHKCTSSPIYYVWKNIKYRCFNPEHKAYKDYGGRGIKVYEGWLDNPKAFIEYVETLGWEEGLQVDRIDNDKNYEPDNLRVVTHCENLQNTRLLRSSNTSGFRGIGHDKRDRKNPYESAIKVDKTKYHLGSYSTPQQGAQAYDIAVILLNGLQPRNFPEFTLKDYDMEIIEKVRNKLKGK